jgi:hypothetical protein
MDSKSNLAPGIVFTTFAEVLLKNHDKSDTNEAVKETVRAAAIHNGARGKLLEALVKNLPPILMAVRSTKTARFEGAVSSAPTPRYEIWTYSEYRNVSDISSYETKKHEYHIWIDLDEKKHISVRSPDVRIKPRAIQLLKYLIERIGQRVSFEVVLKDVFDDSATGKEFEATNQNKIEQQLTAINKFSGREFRKHLFPDKFGPGLGLKRTFSDKYFVFRRLC